MQSKPSQPSRTQQPFKSSRFSIQKVPPSPTTSTNSYQQIHTQSPSVPLFFSRLTVSNAYFESKTVFLTIIVSLHVQQKYFNLTHPHLSASIVNFVIFSPTSTFPISVATKLRNTSNFHSQGEISSRAAAAQPTTRSSCVGQADPARPSC